MKLSIRVENNVFTINVNTMITLSFDIDEVESFVNEFNTIAKLFGKEAPAELMPTITRIIRLYSILLKDAKGTCSFDYNTETKEINITNNSVIQFNINTAIEMYSLAAELGMKSI
jgi:hypothetical protein